ncbi:MAG: NAD-dependent epimerase/dehydratase family protein [Mycobacteriales bacterium]
MRIVITGASGNLGTALLRRLLATPDSHEIVGVCRRPPTDVAPYSSAEWVAVDLAEPAARDVLTPVFEGADAVVHLAWGFQPSHDVDYLERVGVQGTRAVLDAADAAGVPHLVHMSSLGAYSPGPDDRAVPESWPTRGTETLAYSRHKVAAERMLDDYEAAHAGGMAVARIRPALVIQRDAASALLRYGVPGYLPAAALRHVPLLPVDRRLRIQVVHTDDAADAVVRVLEQRATGAFNLAAEPPITRDDIADALGARPVDLPRPVLRGLTAATWYAHLQPLDPGWVDLAFDVPLMDSSRAREELGWHPLVDARDALAEVVRAMSETASTPSPALRPRSLSEQFARLVRLGPITRRRLP